MKIDGSILSFVWTSVLSFFSSPCSLVGCYLFIYLFISDGQSLKINKFSIFQLKLHENLHNLKFYTSRKIIFILGKKLEIILSRP